MELFAEPCVLFKIPLTFFPWRHYLSKGWFCMLDMVGNLSRFVEPVGLTILLVYFYGYYSRTTPTAVRTSMVMGAVFGIAAVISMASPLELADGIIIALRNLFIGISAAFFGWRAAAITLGIAMTIRLGIGGDGTAAGVVAMAIAAGMGLIWTSFIRPRIAYSWASLPILATLISAHGLASFMFPTEIAALFFLKIMPMLFVLNFVGTIAFATLIDRERNLVGETSMLLQAATTDLLTRAMNRRSVMDGYGNLEMLNHPYRGIAIVCIDVDNFKVTNDTYGHFAGDKVLVEISSRIKSCLRGGDLFARMSGDEFLIVLTNVASHEAQVITERCRKIISRVPVAFEGRTIDTGISVGTVWSPRFEPFGEFRDAADVALYRAKSTGRDCMTFNGKHDFDLQTALDAA